MQFSLRFLWSFVRAAPLSPEVKIYLQQGRPLLVKYEMGSSGRNNLGEAVFALAPQYDDAEVEEDGEEAGYDIGQQAETAAALPPIPEQEPEPRPKAKNKRGQADKPRKRAKRSVTPPSVDGDGDGGYTEKCDEDMAACDDEPPEWD